MSKITFLTKPTEKAEQIEQQLRAEIKRQGYSSAENIVFAIGGDGTLLKAIRDHIEESGVFVGISAGTLGFLQAVESASIPQLITTLKAKSYSAITAPLLAVRNAKRTLGYGFNDISIERLGPRAAKFDLNISDAPGSFVGDGVIFATPLGSTAYSLASGGPIIDSRLQNVFVVTPNNPHVSHLYSSLRKPHVLAGDRVVAIMVDHATLAERPLQITIDGYSQPLKEGVEIFLSNKTIQLVQLTSDGFHNRIEDKRLGRH